MSGMIDTFLLVWFSVFLFVAWVFEPAGVYLCGWEGLEECSQQHIVGYLWHVYASKIDPVFLHLPLWLRILNSLDTLLFGFFYAASIFVFGHGGPELCGGIAYAVCGLLFAGALIYSLIVFFAYEVLAQAEHGTHLPLMFLVNLPWTVTPFLLVYRLWCYLSTHSSRVVSEKNKQKDKSL